MAMSKHQPSKETIKLRHLADLAQQEAQQELRELERRRELKTLAEFEIEEPTRPEFPAPTTDPPRSLGKKTADQWQRLPRSVQVITALTALVGALTPLVLAVLEALK